MNALSSAMAAALLAAASTVAVAQAQNQMPQQTQTPTGPSAASSPHQREATGTGTSEAPAESGANPSSASSPQQHQAMRGVSSAELDAAKKAGATPAKFVRTAAEGNMAEIALAKVALEKSSNQDVKQFAQKVIDDHTQANRELLDLAKAQHLTVPTKLDAKHEHMVKHLSARSGSAFDAAYAKHAANSHTVAVALFQSAAESSNSEVADFAKKELPTLQEHEQMADNLRESTMRTASAESSTHHHK